MDLESSLELLLRARNGDRQALEQLLERYRPRLRRWATGRLPHSARSLSDTEDLVQEALIGALRNLPTFELRGEWALQAYLRQAVTNRIRDELRRVDNQRGRHQISPTFKDSAPSPLELAMCREVFAAYESGLSQLDEASREAVIARLELGCSYEEIAALLNKPTADAARMLVSRAVGKVSAVMAQARR